MREIKFRIWCKQQGEMFRVKNLRFDNNELWYAEDYENEVPYYFDNKDCELMQYTGLRDKYRVEIYEGDVLSFLGKNEVVSYENGECALGEFRLSLTASKAILIGNVYENPELTQYNCGGQEYDCRRNNQNI